MYFASSLVCRGRQTRARGVRQKSSKKFVQEPKIVRFKMGDLVGPRKKHTRERPRKEDNTGGPQKR